MFDGLEVVGAGDIAEQVLARASSRDRGLWMRLARACLAAKVVRHRIPQTSTIQPPPVTGSTAAVAPRPRTAAR